MAGYDRYIEGNTVRQAAPAPQWEEPRKTRRELAEEKRQQMRRKAARANRENAGTFHLGHVAFIAACALSIGSCAFVMVQTQASITSRMRHVASLESQIADLKADNDARYKEIVTSVDLDYIKDYAINELGMTYASEDQIEYYQVEKSNYMDQYSDIPQ